MGRGLLTLLGLFMGLGRFVSALVVVQRVVPVVGMGLPCLVSHTVFGRAEPVTLFPPDAGMPSPPRRISPLDRPYTAGVVLCETAPSVCQACDEASFS